MSKTVFLHIGAHKTGTTALQYTAHRHRAALARQGLAYPKVLWTGVAHHLLPMALQGVKTARASVVPSAPDAIAALLAAIEATPCPRVLISSEALFKTRADRLAPLAEALSDHTVRILLTLRRPDDLYLSSYAHRAKDPFDGFEAGLRDHLSDPWTVARDLQMDRYLRPWRDHFGQDALQVFLFEEIDPVTAILGTAGATAPAVSGPTARNSAASARLCRVMLAGKRAGLPLRARRLLYSLARRAFDHGPRFALDADDRRTILRAAAPDLEAGFALIGQPNPYRVDLLRGLSAPDQL